MSRKYTGEKTFAEVLTSYIAAQDKKNSYLYTRACIKRDVFSDMSKKEYQPSFETAIKIALALNLTYAQVTDLLARARFTLSPCFVFDMIIKQFLKNPTYYNSGEYDLAEIDIRLFDSGEVPLFNIEK